MNKTEARRKWGEAYGNWYWANRHRNNPAAAWAQKTKAESVALILDIRKYRQLMRTAPAEQDEHGNTIYRDEDADKFLKIRTVARGTDERYRYDFNYLTPSKGWKQYDTNQDAWYFGIWVNIAERMVFSYAEGDRTLVVYPDDEHLRDGLEHMAEFYGPPPPAFICFSEPEPGKWVREEIYDERPTI
jgi:hypothetical protein